MSYKGYTIEKSGNWYNVLFYGVLVDINLSSIDDAKRSIDDIA